MTCPALVVTYGLLIYRLEAPDSGKYNKNTHHFILSYLIVIWKWNYKVQDYFTKLKRGAMQNTFEDEMNNSLCKEKWYTFACHK